MAEREKERTGGDIGLRGGKGKEEDGEMMRQVIASGGMTRYGLGIFL